MKIGDQGGDFIIERLNQNGYKAYYVGGCVRDSLLGLCVSDYDITTNCTPDRLIEIFQDKKVLTVGIKHGTISVSVDGKFYEVTTFRCDGDYFDNRHPSKVEFCTNLLSDLSRRDFCCNALAYNKNEGLIDYFNGFYDIENRVLRAVGDPSLRFEEDALRILRAIRFSSKLGFIIESETKKALLRGHSLLKKISKERIFLELKGILLGKNCLDVLVEFRDVICSILPLLGELSLEQFNCAVLMVSNSRTLVVKLAVLLFYLNEIDTKKTLLHLRCDNAIINRVLKLHNFKNFFPTNSFEIKQLMNSFNGDLADYFELQEAICSSEVSKIRTIDIKNIHSNYSNLLSNGECYSLKQLAVDGNDVARYCSGVKIGQCLNELLDAVMRNEVENNKNALLNYLKRLL